MQYPSSTTRLARTGISALSDRLGRIYDRDTFLDLARSEVKRAQRYGRSMTVLLLEVDDRDAIAAKYGEGWVDILVDIVAMVCRETLREPDILGRYSDSVLAFVLPESVDSAGVRLAARLIEGVSDIRLPSAKGQISFTVSAGVAASVGGVADVDEILAHAERQLAAAHGAGVEKVKGCFVGERRENLDEALSRLGRRQSDSDQEESTSVELTHDELEMLLNRKPN